MIKKWVETIQSLNADWAMHYWNCKKCNRQTQCRGPAPYCQWCGEPMNR